MADIDFMLAVFFRAVGLLGSMFALPVVTVMCIMRLHIAVRQPAMRLPLLGLVPIAIILFCFGTFQVISMNQRGQSFHPSAPTAYLLYTALCMVAAGNHLRAKGHDWIWPLVPVPFLVMLFISHTCFIVPFR